jgi:enterochelin esterase family protein
VPWIEARYRITNDPSRITIAGSSAGGLASTCAAFFHPERFGTVLSQSGAYWWGMETPDHRPEWITRQIEASPKRPIRFYLDVGLLENSHIADEPTMIDVNRRLRDVLRAKGYEVHYAEVDGGHEHLSWQGTLANGLIALLGGSAR